MSAMYFPSRKEASAGNAWDSIAEKLNQIIIHHSFESNKRGDRERWELLLRKFKSTEKEAASGIAVYIRLVKIWVFGLISVIKKDKLSI